MLIFKLLGGHLGFCKIPQIDSDQGLSGIKAISKYEVNQTSGFKISHSQPIVEGLTDEWTDGRTDRAIP